jgi:hypothetical protein
MMKTIRVTKEISTKKGQVRSKPEIGAVNNPKSCETHVAGIGIEFSVEVFNRGKTDESSIT